MPGERWKAKARRYATLRWVGVALFCVAAPNLLAAIGAVATDRASGGLILVSLFATGLSLGSFGTNDDAALHAFAELDRREALNPTFKAELDAERKKRPGRVQACHDHPKASLIVPSVAVLALGLAVWRVATAWGLVA